MRPVNPPDSTVFSVPRSSAQVRERRRAEVAVFDGTVQRQNRTDIDPCHPIMALPIEVQKWSQRLWCLPVSRSSVSATGLRKQRRPELGAQQRGIPRAAPLIPAMGTLSAGRKIVVTPCQWPQE